MTERQHFKDLAHLPPKERVNALIDIRFKYFRKLVGLVADMQLNICLAAIATRELNKLSGIDLEKMPEIKLCSIPEISQAIFADLARQVNRKELLDAEKIGPYLDDNLLAAERALFENEILKAKVAEYWEGVN